MKKAPLNQWELFYAQDVRYLKNAGAIFNGMHRMCGILKMQEQFLMVCTGCAVSYPGI